MCTNTVSFLRRYSSSKAISYFTTPIYYVNGNPHIGHLYSSVIADATQRWQRIRNIGAKIKFATGTDEHGLKIQRAANAHVIQSYCDAISSEYRNLADQFGVQYTDFIRTTEERHKNTVQRFWKCLDKNGHIYKANYKGWYCPSDETFLNTLNLNEIEKDDQTLLVSAESGHRVEWTEEPNYMFKLSSFGDDLVYWLTRNENAIRPQKFRKMVLDLIDASDAISDISVSRPISRVHWGIPVPDDDTQTIYVWLDALVNYLTVAGYSQVSNEQFGTCWPPDVQVIGKDILKFHGIYWPAFLIAAGLEPPRTILCHSHWTVNGEKMSKSKGNVVDPKERSGQYTADGLRYFLLRAGVNHSDGNYSDINVVHVLNSELANTMGNLLSRCCGKVLNPFQVFPHIDLEVLRRISSLDVTKTLLNNLQQLPSVCETHYDDFNFYKVADSVIATLHSANLFFETLKPWELKKSSGKVEELNVVLHLAIESLRIAGILLQPLVPQICDNLLSKINVPKGKRCFEDATVFSWNKGDFKDTPLSNDDVILFKRILVEEFTKAKAA